MRDSHGWPVLASIKHIKAGKQAEYLQQIKAQLPWSRLTAAQQQKVNTAFAP